MSEKKPTANKAAAKTPAARKKARLGRGLGALLGEVQSAEPGAGGGAKLHALPVTQLRRGAYQPRRDLAPAALEELAESIKAKGVIQPLVVREIAAGQFEIIAGERRWRAAQRAGLTTVPAVIRQVDDQNAMALALIENIQREDLNAIEEAAGLRRLLNEFRMTHAEAAAAVGKSRATVTNLLRLLTLHKEVQKTVETGQLDMGHARELLRLPAARQPLAARQIIAGALSVRQTEALVKNWLAAGSQSGRDKTGGADRGADVIHLQEKLSARLGAEVLIQHGADRGKVIIRYHSLDELDGIIARIK